MDIGIIFNQVVVLFMVMFIGFYAKKKGIITDMVGKKLSELLLRITSPFLVISSFQLEFSQEMLHNVFIVLVFALVAHVFSILFGKVLYYKYPDRVKKIMKFATVYSNCGFMGFPILSSLFGKPGVLYGSIYVAVFNVFLWTNGVMIFKEKKGFDLKKVITNPGFFSVIIGMLFFVFSISLPAPVSKTLEMVGSMTTPLSMLIVGAVLAEVEIKQLLYGFPLYYVTAVRLLVIPLLTLLVMKLIGVPGVIAGTCVLLVAMPVAATTTIFAEMYDGDAPFASRIVAFSTLASIVTMPLVISFVR